MDNQGTKVLFCEWRVLHDKEGGKWGRGCWFILHPNQNVKKTHTASLTQTKKGFSNPAETLVFCR
jgi:hypothetical protein